jgi:subtilisin family serine protease
MELREGIMAETKSGQAPVCHYRAFWHLEAVGVLKPVIEDGMFINYAAPVWDKLKDKQAATVALIDTGVSRHPYFADRISGHIDLTGLPMRAPAGENLAKQPPPFEGMNGQFLTNLGLEGRLAPDDFSWLVRFVEANEDRVPFDFHAPDAGNSLFSSHGTACAGLIIASSDIPSPDGATVPMPLPLAYTGVDPFSKLLSITTTFAPRPETLILAFLYAAIRKVDVILVPRSIAGDVMQSDGDDPTAAADATRRAWRTLRAVILTVSEWIPVVCAAGNDAESRLIAPAALAVENEGRNGIIAVGAISYEAIRSSYSSYGPGLTVVGPSDDGEMFNEDQMRLDKTNRFFRDYPYEATARRAEVEEFAYAQASVLAIDIPGAFGFEGSGNGLKPALQTISQFSGYFTEFGGTSAAAAIVAGVAALVQRAAKKSADDRGLRGPEVRKILSATARKEGERLPHDDGQKIATPDIINKRGKKERLTFEQAFGAGVVNAGAAVDKVLQST